MATNQSQYEEMCEIYERYIKGGLVPVVRCKDCTYYQEGFRGEHWCTKHSSAYSIMQWGVKEDDYCSWAERRKDETD